MAPSGDPYKVLGISRSASDQELRSAYRRLVRLHHPDHNGGSLESARRFEEVQEAYSRIRELRKTGPPLRRTNPGIPASTPACRTSSARSGKPPPRPASQPAARSRGGQRRRGPRARARARERPSDEELGYITTDDSFSKIVSDVWEELSDRFSEAKGHPSVKRVEDLIDDLQGRYRPKR